MPKVAPSQRVREEIERVLRDGVEGKADVTSTLLRLGAQRLTQEVLEEEVTDFLGRERYVRHRGGQPHRGYRNGNEPGRVRTAEGEIPIQVPQVRQTPEPFQSKLLTFLRGHTDVLQRLVAEMYARGLSTRDIEDAFRDGTGHCLGSASAVSELTDRLWEDYEAFTTRDLSGFAVEYLFLDAIYESLRLQGGPAEVLLCAWAILVDGRKVLLHLTLGNKESYAAWLTMLRDVVRRGVRPPVSVTSDGASGLVRAVEEVWPKSLRLRCWVHKMRNILDKVPDDARAEVQAYLISVRDAPTYGAGQQALQATVARLGGVPRRCGVAGRRPRSHLGAPAAARCTAQARQNHEPHRAQLPRGAPADENHPSLLRRAQLPEARVRHPGPREPTLASGAYDRSAPGATAAAPPGAGGQRAASCGAALRDESREEGEVA
jgi:transposase-like protein